MPKRSAQEKIDHYQEKIRRLQSKNKKRKRVISSDEEQEIQDCHQDQTTAEEINSDVNNIHDDLVTNGPEAVPDRDTQAPVIDSDSPVPTAPDLDPELLLALGETSTDSPDYGPIILESQARLWLPILKRGLPKEPKENLLKQYLIPDNCRLLQAPKLNAEITAAIPDMVRNRDKGALYIQQQQLGAGITATNRAMDLLLLAENKIEALKQLSNGCRLLTDLHYQFTQSRIKLIIPSLDKTSRRRRRNAGDAERDETLFGKNLSERIKAAKAFEKQGLQIKRVAPQKPTASTSQQPIGLSTRETGEPLLATRPTSGAGREPSAGTASATPPVHSSLFEFEERSGEQTPCNTAAVMQKTPPAPSEPYPGCSEALRQAFVRHGSPPEVKRPLD